MDYRDFLEASTGRQKADLVLKNARILDVYNAEFFNGDLAIHKGRIIGIGDYEGLEELDLEGRHVVPGFIDGHLHIESSMVTPPQYARGILPHGVTTIVADPHEMANVLGPDGVTWMMDASKDLPLNIHFMIPSCVPCSPNEHGGSDLSAADMAALKNRPEVLGMGEMMDFPNLLAGDSAITEKLRLFQDMPKDGHGPGLSGRDLNAYAAAGITTDHECTTVEEMQEKIRLGMYVQIREGTAAKNAAVLLPGVNDSNWRRCFFCSDDQDPFDLITKGTVKEVIKMALELGMDPARAYTMGSFNAASAYDLKDRGALSPGMAADLVILEDVETVDIKSVYVRGRLIHEKGGEVAIPVRELPAFNHSVTIADLDESALELSGSTYHAMVMQPGSLYTPMETGSITSENFPYSQGMNKLVNVERHKGLPLTGVCALKGLGVRNGAIATTIAHDSHNLLAVGDNDEDILLAIRHTAEIGGGYVMVSEGRVIQELRLPIAGLLSPEPIEDVAATLENMLAAAHQELGIPEDVDPFLSLSFMALPVIPEVKLTVEGLFSVSSQKLLPAAE